MTDFTLNPEQVRLAAGVIQRQCHGLAKASGWWTDLQSGRLLVGEFAYMQTPHLLPPRSVVRGFHGCFVIRVRLRPHVSEPIRVTTIVLCYMILQGHRDLLQ